MYMCQPIWLLGHTSNKLPFDLKSIGHKSEPHLLKISFNLLLAQCLCQWSSHILCGVDSLHLNELLEIFMNKMESSLNVIWLLVRPQFLNKCYDTIVVAEKWNDIWWHYTQFCNKLFEPESFISSLRYDDVLCLHDGICNDRLFGTLLTNRTIIT